MAFCYRVIPGYNIGENYLLDVTIDLLTDFWKEATPFTLAVQYPVTLTALLVTRKWSLASMAMLKYS